MQPEEVVHERKDWPFRFDRTHSVSLMLPENGQYCDIGLSRTKPQLHVYIINQRKGLPRSPQRVYYVLFRNTIYDFTRVVFVCPFETSKLVRNYREKQYNIVGTLYRSFQKSAKFNGLSTICLPMAYTISVIYIFKYTRNAIGR